jgi:glycosyltransferase involved in cell wall biosynthesis
MNEAMACSRIAIASNKCGGAEDLIENNISGYIFPFGSLEKLIEVMRKVYVNKAETKNMGVNAFNKIQSFNFESIAQVIERNV